MTIEEAKKMIQIEKSCINGHCDRNCGKCDIAQDIDDLNSAYDIVLQNLDKEIPKKITIFKYPKINYINYGCPVCRRKIISKIDNVLCCGELSDRCDRCGQKLDWSGEDV